MSPRRPDLDDLDREIREHLDAETRDNVARGMTEEEARTAARRTFGNVARVKEDVRAIWIPGWIDSLRQDARDAVRYVRRTPGVSLAIVVTLSLGIGLSTAIFSVVNAVLLRPLAYAHPERMVWLSTRAPDSSRDMMNSIDFAAWQSQATSFEHMIAYDAADATLAAGGDASRLRIVSASTGFWEVTGALPALGILPTEGDPQAARAEIDAIHARQQRDHPTPSGTTSVVVMPLQEKIVGPSRRALGILLSASFVVLLITCANVANLLLSRAAERRKEMALRMALGSGPLRVVRQLFAESLAYALLGGAGGVLLSVWLVNTVIAVIGAGVPRLTETQIDSGVLAVAAAISIGTALLFGIGPALAVVVTNVNDVLKEGGRTVSASRRVRLTGRAMVAVQVALTIILLCGAGLMVKSLWRMTRYPAGFAPDRILTMRVDVRGPQYRDPQARRHFTQALVAKAKTLPGVRDAAMTTGRASMMLVIKEGEGVPPPDERDKRAALVSSISPRFGPLLGMSLVSGRWFAEVDSPGVAIVNESLARRDFAGTDPIGRRIRMPWLGENGLATIVGVARDLKYAAIDADAAPELFFHYTERPISSAILMVRVNGDPIAAAPAIRNALATIDPTQSFYNVKTLENVLSDSIAPRRFNLLLLGTFATVALVLAALGVYGVVAYAVSERTHEIGIRMALGAERSDVVRMMVAQGLWSVVAGLGAGLYGAWAATRLMAGMLYDVEPHDPATFVVTAAVLGAIACVACMVPARQAARVDPVTALRGDG